MEDNILKRMEQAFEAFTDTYDHLPEDHVFSEDYLARRSRLLRRYRHKEMTTTSRSGLRTVAAVAAVLLLGAGTVYAGVNGFRLRQNATYQVDADLPEQAPAEQSKTDSASLSAQRADEGEPAATDAQQELSAAERLTEDAAIAKTMDLPKVQLVANWMPEELSSSDGKEVPLHFSDDALTRGYFLNTYVLDSNAPIRLAFVVNSENMTIAGHEAALFEIRNRTDDVNSRYRLFILFPEYARLVELNAWGQTDRDELLEVAENLTFVEVEEYDVQYAAFYDRSWDDIAAWMKKDLETAAMASSNTSQEAGEIDALLMTNLHAVGDPFCPFYEWYQVIDEAEIREDYVFLPDVRATVKEVVTADDLSILSDGARLPESWKGQIGADGSLLNGTDETVSAGNGIDTLGEVLSTETYPVKLVYATVEYENTGTEDISDLYFSGSLEYLVQTDGTWHFAGVDGQVADLESDRAGLTRQMQYYDVPGQTCEKNYLPLLKAGQTQQIHYAWIVPEACVDTLYLNLTGLPLNGQRPFEKNIPAQVGLVEMRQK